MRRGHWADDLQRLIDASWELVITVPTLVSLDVPERTAYRRTLENGPWQRLLPATLLLSNGLPTFRQWQIAALLYAGPDAVLTGLGGARLHGLRRGDEPEKHHVLIPATRNVKSSGPVIVERTWRPVKRLERDGLPVAPIARCLLDHVRRTKNELEIAALLTEPVQRRMVPKETLIGELDLGTRKGSAAPRRVLRAVSAGVESPTEFQYYEFWATLPGLPAIRCNVPVFDLEGNQIGIVDFLADEVGLVWESDSVEEHFATPDQVLATAERARLLRAAGLYVLSTRPHQLREDPRGLETDIRQALEIARSMPPPRVTFGRPSAA